MEPEVAISAARSLATQAAGEIIAESSAAGSPCSQRTEPSSQFPASVSLARTTVSVHTALAPVTFNNVRADSLISRSSTGTATRPAYMAPK